MINTKTGKIISLCEYMQIPMPGTRNLNFTSGPRPRVTGGWGGKEKGL